MSELFRRWLPDSAEGPAAGSWPEARAWAVRHGHRFAVGRGGEGFVVESSASGSPCRIEWGPSQRNYIAGQELRVRIDLGASTGLQMLAVSRELLLRLENDVFEQFTEGTETRMDDATPEEMRWVVLYPQVPATVLGPLASRFGLLSNKPRASTLWLEEGLASALAASVSWHARGAPTVLVMQRGRFVLRMGLAEPSVAELEGAFTLGMAAAAAARRVVADMARSPASSQRPSVWESAAGAPALEAQRDD